MIFLVSQYLQDIRDLDPRATGLILLTTVIFMVLLLCRETGRPYCPLTRRRNWRGSLLRRADYIHIPGNRFFSAFRYSRTFSRGRGDCFLSVSPGADISSVQKEMYGLASGMIETMRLLGMTISITIAGIIFTVFLGNARITPPFSRCSCKASIEVL